MSLAVPASYNEYYYTSQNDGLICDGGIMPLRNGAADSTWYRNCLRAEDLMFLNEANNIRGKCCGRLNGVPTPTKYIESNKLNNIRNNIGYMWNYASPAQPNLQAHTFDGNTLLDDNGVGVDEYIQSSFRSKTRYSANDTYYHNHLRADQMMNLFKDIKQMNYFYQKGDSNNNSAFPYNNNKGCETEVTYSNGRTPDINTYSNYLWYDQIYYEYEDNVLGYHWDEHTISSYLTFSVKSDTTDLIPKTLIDLSIWGGFYVTNYAGKRNIYDEYGSITNEYKYVLAPIKSSYQNMSSVTQPTVSSSELQTAVNLVYSTSGLGKSSIGIPCGDPPDDGVWHKVYHSAHSNCQLLDIYYFSHVRYCTLENVSV